jgi:hypothetical protein
MVYNQLGEFMDEAKIRNALSEYDIKEVVEVVDPAEPDVRKWHVVAVIDGQDRGVPVKCEETLIQAGLRFSEIKRKLNHSDYK